MEFLNRFRDFFCDLPDGTTWAADPGLMMQRSGPPNEAALVSRAVEKRQREFRSGRNMARQALSQLDIPCAEVLRDRAGAPIWPAGVCGSITHCETLAVAVVSTSLDGIGVDVEPIQTMQEGVRNLVLSPEDQLPSDDPTWPLRVFCAKEAFYKAWSSVLSFVPDFQEAAIRAARPSEFRIYPLSVRLQSVVQLPTVVGRWAEIDGYIVAYLARPHIDQSSKNASFSSI